MTSYIITHPLQVIHWNKVDNLHKDDEVVLDRPVGKKTER